MKRTNGLGSNFLRFALALGLVASLTGCGDPDPQKILLAPNAPALPYAPPTQLKFQESDIVLAGDLPKVELKTSKGNIVIELFEDEVPNTVANFIKLVEDNYYANHSFHRVEKDLVQTGQGAMVPWRIEFEKSDKMHCHVRGAVGMAQKEGKHTGDTQFYIMKNPNLDSDRNYVVFGRVLEGLDVVDKIIQGADKLLSASVRSKRDHPYNVNRLPLPAEEQMGGINFRRQPPALPPPAIEEIPIPAKSEDKGAKNKEDASSGRKDVKTEEGKKDAAKDPR